MAEASVFLRKKKDKQRQRVSSHAAPSPPTVTTPRPEAAPSPKPKVEVETANGLTSNNSNIIEFKLISSGKPEGVRHNLMRLNASRDVDPTIISRPILFNRKTPGPKAPPVFAYDEGGNVKGRYVYAPDGKPVLGEDGQPVVEMKDEADLSLVGTAPGQPKRKVKKGVKEVFHQDIELIRLRREENMPWILESGQPKDNAAIPEHWVGRLIEPSSMPTVLLINDGTMGMGFSVVPLGRTYRFDPERPFKVLDPEAAHKLVCQPHFQPKHALMNFSMNTNPSTRSTTDGHNVNHLPQDHPSLVKTLVPSRSSKNNELLDLNSRCELPEEMCNLETRLNVLTMIIKEKVAGWKE